MLVHRSFAACCISDLSMLMSFSVAAKLLNFVALFASNNYSSSLESISTVSTTALLTIFDFSLHPKVGLTSIQPKQECARMQSVKLTLSSVVLVQFEIARRNASNKSDNDARPLFVGGEGVCSAIRPNCGYH